MKGLLLLVFVVTVSVARAGASLIWCSNTTTPLPVYGIGGAANSTGMFVDLNCFSETLSCVVLGAIDGTFTVTSPGDFLFSTSSSVIVFSQSCDPAECMPSASVSGTLEA